MGLITRKRLSRGIKLLRDHVFQPLEDAATQLGGSMNLFQLKEDRSVFHVHWHVPVLGGTLFATAFVRKGNFMLPFTLPPHQEDFSTTGQADSTNLSLVLDEFQLSFDTRLEDAAIRDVDGIDGHLDFDNTDSYDIKVRLMEKKMVIFDSGASPIPEQEVLSFDLPSTLWFNADLRQNPLIVTGLEKVLHPYRTYVLYIDASDLFVGAGVDMALVSLNISLKLRATVTTRDYYDGQASFTQNIPTDHDGVLTAPTYTIQTPAYDSDIEADTPTGVGTNIEVIDGAFLSKLRAGYNEYGEVPVEEELSTDAGYEVIMVPMFGGMDRAIFNSTAGATISRLPYAGTTPFTDPVGDRRIIPIKFPFVVHHVLAVCNWAMTPATVNKKPTSADLITEIGVGIGTGLRADDFDYQQVAYVTFTGANRGNFVVDRIKERSGGRMSDGDYDMEILQVPLVHNDPGNFVGTSYPISAGAPYDKTGTPFYVGKGNTVTQARRNAVSAVGGSAGTPVTNGAEQWIEVRWTFKDTVNGLDDLATYPDDTVFVGYGGNWLCIVGKKSLA